jgi:hypothetical protein
MIEECACCGAYAPSWDTDDYAGWTLELTPGGDYLGVICSGCFGGEGLAFLDIEVAVPAVVELRRASAPAGSGGRDLAEAA